MDKKRHWWPKKVPSFLENWQLTHGRWWVKKVVSFFSGWHRQLPPRVTPILVTPLPCLTPKQRQTDTTWHRSGYCRGHKNISVRAGICMRRCRPVTWQPIDESFPVRHTARAHCVPFPTSRRVQFPAGHLTSARYFELWTFLCLEHDRQRHALHQLIVAVR